MNLIKGKRQGKMDHGSDDCTTLEIRMTLKMHLPESDTPAYDAMIREATISFWDASKGGKQPFPKRALGQKAPVEVRREKKKARMEEEEQQRRAILAGDNNE